MPNTSIVLQTQELPVFNDSSFFSSMDAIDSFFGRVDFAVKELQDDQLLNFFSLVNQMGNRAWMSRAIILEEISNRTKEKLNKEELSKEEFEQHVARALDIAKSTAYEDLQILKNMKAMQQEGHEVPRLERAFYRMALSAPDFPSAIEHATQEYDSLGGKYTAKQFARWVAIQRGDIKDEQQTNLVSVSFTPEEITGLVTAVKYYLKNDPTALESSTESAYQKLLNKNLNE